MNYCKFHPVVDAVYNCSECDIQCCEDCCDEASGQNRFEQEHKCFICGFPLDLINEGSDVVPFWRELSKIYRYPSSASALIVIFGTALLTTLFSSSLLLLIFPSIAITHYCFACLRSTANGNMQPPGFEASIEGSIAPIFYVILVIFNTALLIGGATSMFGAGFGILSAIVSIAVIPAAILIIAIDERLLPALNMGKLMGIVAAMGTSYFVMLLFILMMSSSVGVLNYLFASDAESGFGIFIQAAISNYYSIIIFHILGYLVHQNGHRLGFANQETRKEYKVRTPSKRLNAKIEVMVKSGNYAEAIELCAQQVKSGDANLWQWHRCFKLLLISESTKRLEAFSKLYFKKLDDSQQVEPMADAYVKIKRRIPTFEMQDAEMQIKVAEALINIGKYKYVVLLLRQFHKVSKVKSLLGRSFNLLSQAYERIPGQEQKAVLYKQQSERISTN